MQALTVSKHGNEAGTSSGVQHSCHRKNEQSDERVRIQICEWSMNEAHWKINPAGSAVEQARCIQGFGVLHNTEGLVLPPTLVEDNVGDNAWKASVLLHATWVTIRQVLFCHDGYLTCSCQMHSNASAACRQMQHPMTKRTACPSHAKVRQAVRLKQTRDWRFTSIMRVSSCSNCAFSASAL